jgi:hypothetical protein
MEKEIGKYVVSYKNRVGAVEIYDRIQYKLLKNIQI